MARRPEKARVTRVSPRTQATTPADPGASDTAGSRLDLPDQEKRVIERETALVTRERLVVERETALATHERHLSNREVTLLESERDIVRRENSLATREHELTAMARKLDERDEDLAIREAAADEALSLANDSLTATPTAEENADLPQFEGPDMELPKSSAEAALAVMREESEKRRTEEVKLVQEEARQLLTLTREVPALAPLEARLLKAMEDSMSRTAVISFYNMAVRILVEKRKTETASDERLKTLEAAVYEKQKALDDATGMISTLKEDFARYRNRQKTEQESFVARSNEELLRRVIQVADNFDRAVVAATGATNVAAVISGIEMIQRLFEEFLANEGLVPIKAVGTKFDPRVHEALMDMETSTMPEDTVCEEIQRGYSLGGKVLRPALVKVARAPRVSGVSGTDSGSVPEALCPPSPLESPS